MAVGKYLPEANPGPAEDVAVTIKNLLEGLGGGSQLSHDQLDDVSVDDHHAQSHNIASHSDTTATGTELDALTDNSMADTLHRHSELSASDGSPDRIVYTNSDGVLFADALGTGASSGLGLDVMYGATIGTHLTIGNNITVGGTVDGVDIAARDHAASHSVASHNDTTATGANLNTLVGGGETALHSHAAAGATKEFFVPAHPGSTEANFSYTGDHPRIAVTVGGALAYVEFIVPADFSSVTSAVYLITPNQNDATVDIDIRSDYAANGEAYNAHSESDTASTHSLTANQFYELDVSGILSSLAVGDYVGVKLTNSDAQTALSVYGLRFKYA